MFCRRFGRLIDRSVKDDYCLRDDRGAARDHKTGFVPCGGIHSLDQDSNRRLSTLVTDNLSRGRKTKLAGSRDLAEHGTKYVVRARLERHRLSGIVRVELKLEQVAQRGRHSKRRHV